MQVVFDFLTGDLSFDAFWKEHQQNPEIGEWIDQLTDFSGDPPPKIEKDSMLNAIYRAVAVAYDGHILRMMAKSPYPPEAPHTLVSRQYSIFAMIQTAVVAKYPNIKPTKHYRQDDEYYYKALGNSIGGREVMGYAAAVLEQFPRTMKAAEREKPERKRCGRRSISRTENFPAGCRKRNGPWASILPWNISARTAMGNW